ncbi:isocitrate lyase/phosphoenolpyruvate mutase family protein [Streptomyces sp. ISL-66]|uniref:isocitrate lyase/PEP mutase family protein n=1 Tax=Streptomyces sp. ISL-66 TaxID=2819186 RepID=UPI001BEC2E9D|nr:isocitrate lyase/phosphoenolpyruvate mutase family protein [Streptomyces sp. ISL-66]MBT2468528.1 isocitrate lyase/phosphoenolpyruvate mutase family protein [Streptomyces sp. ISL-66]
MPSPAPAPSPFHALHRADELLFLPCVWDTASARLFSALPTVKALGTTSAGLAAAHGVGDGQQLAPADLLRAVEGIRAATALPVSVDLERGYADDAKGVHRFVGELLDLGVSGINLEDGLPENGPPGPGRAGGGTLADPAEHAERLAAARAAADDRGLPLFVNARTDVWWHPAATAPHRLFETGASRLRRYLAAGADGVFAPGYPARTEPDGPAAIRRLVAAVDGAPLNLLLRPGLPALAELAGLGVRRVSTGSGLYRLALAQARRAYATIADGGPSEAVSAESGLPYAELARLLRAEDADGDLAT